jgi:hypothetical protein
LRFLIPLLCAASTAHAIGKASRGGASIEATGNLRLLGGYLRHRDLPGLPTDDGLGAAVSRLIVKGDLAADLTYDVHLFLDLSRGAGGLGGTFATAGSFVTPYRTRFLAWDFWNEGAVRGQLGLDRIAVQGRWRRLGFGVGRFPINHSVTRVFTPNDFFAPFSATAINRAYKPGVDALRLSVELGALAALELDAVLGSDGNGVPAFAESALLLRASMVILGFDAALLGGKLAGRWIGGASLQGDAGPIGVRAEGHVGFADRDGDGRLDEAVGEGRDRIHGRVAGGAGWRSNWRNFAIDVEYAWFSDGAAGAAAYLTRLPRRFADDLPYLGQHYVGLSLGLELLPVLRAGALALVSATDGSGLAVVSLSYDISDESAFAGGLLVPWGAPPDTAGGTIALRSEYGAAPLAAFVETRFFF